MKLALKILIPFSLFAGVLLVLLSVTKSIKPLPGPPNSKRRQVIVKGVDRGLKPHAGETVTETYLGDAPPFQRTYSTDKFNMRPTQKKSSAKKYLVLAGCSFTFGVGVEDQHTLPVYLQNQLPDYQGYNLGSMGGGLHTVIWHVGHFAPRHYLKEKSGDFIYVFMEDHIRRFLGDFRFVRWAPSTAPYYRVEGDKLTYKGKISDQLKTKIFQFSRNFGIENHLSYLDDTITDRDLAEFARAVGHLRHAVEAKFPASKFHFAVHPSFPLVQDRREILLKGLHQRGIHTIDVTGEFHGIVKERNLTMKDLRVVNDPHPSEVVNEIFSELLARKLTSEH